MANGRGLLVGLALIGGVAMAGSHGGGGGGAPASVSSSVPSGTLGCHGLETLWVDANGAEGDPVLMASIAMAESSGEENATSSAGAMGYWQELPGVWPAATYDPLGNARLAGKILRKQGLGAWSAYNNGSYAGKC